MYVDGEEYQCNGVSVFLINSYYSDSATYQWKKNDNIIIGESKSRLAATTSGLYNVIVKDKCFDLESPKSNLSFNNSIPNKISSLVNSSDSRLICGSIKGSLSASSSYNRNTTIFPYTYQWKKDGVNIPNKTSSRLDNIQDEGSYSLTLTQGNCISNSESISFTKADTIKLKLSIPSYHANEICSGLSVDLNVGNIIPLQGVQISYFNGGVRFYPFTYNDGLSTFISQAGKYTVSGTATGCIILPSDTVRITVSNKLKPIIYSEENILCGGSSLSMEAASGQYRALPNINHKWYRNNQIILNENSPFSSLTNVTQAGFYKLKVTSGSCTGFSDSIQVKAVTQIPKPQIIKNSEATDLTLKPLSICNNTLVKLTAISDSYNPDKVVFDSLYWKRNGVIISKQNKYESIPTVQSGTYTVIGKRGTCQTESDPVEIKIGEPITANITGSTSIYPGQKAKLNLNFTGGNAWSYQTSDVATGQTTSLSPTLKNVSPSSTQTYSITSVASNCGVGTVTGNATVTVLPCPTTQAISLNTGNWNTASTWVCGQIPTPTLDTIIEQGHTVRLPNGYQGNTKKLELKGNLTQGAGASVRVSN
jgi:trimeric autotransporter adhesin